MQSLFNSTGKAGEDDSPRKAADSRPERLSSRSRDDDDIPRRADFSSRNIPVAKPTEEKPEPAFNFRRDAKTSETKSAGPEPDFKSVLVRATHAEREAQQNALPKSEFHSSPVSLPTAPETTPSDDLTSPRHFSGSHWNAHASRPELVAARQASVRQIAAKNAAARAASAARSAARSLPQLEPQRAVHVPAEKNIAAPAASPEDDNALPPSAAERRWYRLAIYGSLAVLAAIFGSLAGLTLVYSVDLPQVDEIEHYRPSTTTELLDVHGRPIGSFALERREIVTYDDFAPILRKSVISIEDKSFERNWGVNIFRVAGSAYHNLMPGAHEQGASTLTMQLARNLFLTPERTFGRKIREVMISLQLEHHFTKRQIFTLYGNQIYLGHGVYGFEAGAQFYFSKHASQVTLPEAAMLAALPKGPEYYSPIKYPDRALRRRNLVIDSLLNDGVISAEEADAAKATPLNLHIAPPPNTVAPWFVEEVRRQLERKYGVEKVHQAGLRVYTTLDLDLQKQATRSVNDGLAAYERRRGWVGQLPNLYAQGIDADSFHHPDWDVPMVPGGYEHAVITEVNAQQAILRVGKAFFQMTPDDWRWTGASNANNLLRAGDIVYIQLPQMSDAAMQSLIGDQSSTTLPHASLEQDSGAEGSLLAIDNSTGDILAMVGGRDFQLSQFNRATQAMRQTGSSFKPYVYTAAVEAGVRPEDTIADSPATFMTASGPYTPHNYEGNFLGNISVQHAFAESRNIPALRLAERVGIQKVIDVARRFGLRGRIEPYLPVALGAAEATLYEQVQAYSVFPNEGMRMVPRVIRKVTAADGTPLDDDVKPLASDAISASTARTMMTLLQEVTRSGTAAAAASLHHAIGGKTGTTNDFTDAWFIGFSPSITAGVWVGYDDRRQLGDNETGARAALPVWMDFMRVAISDHPDEDFLLDTPRMHTNTLHILPQQDAPEATPPDAQPEMQNDIAQNAAPKATEPPTHDIAYDAHPTAKNDVPEKTPVADVKLRNAAPVSAPAAAPVGSIAVHAAHPAQSAPVVLPALATAAPRANAAGK